MPDSPVIEITEPIELQIVDDRLLFTCRSGRRQQTFSVSFHKARNALMVAEAMLNGREREQRIRLLGKRE